MLSNCNILQRSANAASSRALQIVCAVLVVVSTVCIPQFAGATHLIGGDLRYRCLGNNQYEIKLTYRRDCFLGVPGTQFEDTAAIGFFNLADNSPLQFIGPNGLFRIPRSPIDTATQLYISDCTLAGNDLCVEQTFYIDTITLPPFMPGYRIAYQRCCRNSSLNNVFDPTNTGMTLVAELSWDAQQVCNSSPILGDYPPIYICVNRDIDFDFVASDEDGDSLIFELFTPFLGASDFMPQPSPPPAPPYTQVQWNSPTYSIDNLLGGVPLTIDRFTGHIAGTPNTIGQFLVGVKIFSYRNGQLIETTTREWQYNVRPCRDVPIADFTVSTNLNCDNLSIDFAENSQFSDQYLWIFDYGNPNSMTSGDQNPTFEFPGPGFYNVALIVNDIDSICFDTAYATVGVFESQVAADFDLEVPTCDESILLNVIDLSDDPDPMYDIVTWQYVISDSLFTDTTGLQNPQYQFTQSTSGIHLELTVTSSNGCTAVVDTTFDVNIIQLPLKGDTVGVCFGDSVLLFNHPGGPFDYMWTPLEGLLLSDPGSPGNPLAFPDETTTYYVTVTDGLCVVSDSAVVAVQDLPALSFTTDTDCRSLLLNTDNTSVGGFQYLWYFGDGDSSMVNSPTHTYDSAGVYTITLVSNDGCDVQTSSEITVNVIDDPVENAATSCFMEDVVLNPVSVAEYEYLWEPSDLLNDATAGSPIASVEETTTFTVTITDPELPGCSITETVVVTVPPDFELQSTPDSTYCEAPPITLTGANPDLSYTWCDLNGNTLSTGTQFTVQPEETTSYIVKGEDNAGCVKRDTIVLAPTFFSIEAGGDTTLCFGEETTIFVNNLDPTQDLSYVWTPAGFIDGDNTVSSPTAKPGDKNITYYVTVMNDEVGCTTVDSVRILVSTFKLEYTPSQLICRFDTFDLAVGSFDTTNLMFMWEPTDQILDGEDTATPTVSPSETTTYTATVTDDYGCQTTLNVTVNVSWFTPGDLIITSDVDTIILGDKVFHITTNQDPSLMYQWSGPGIDGSTTGPDIIANPPSEGTYTYSVTVTNQDGCEVVGQITGLVVLDPLCNDETVFVPDAFSPNGDGYNDVFEVYSNFIASMELHVYNRWGEEVFVSYDQGTTWDGTFKGKDLAPDVFGYYLRVVCIPNKPFFKKGNVTLFR